jgi:endo-1,4-beta-xylanase
MKQLKTGLFLALLACAGIFIMSCPEPDKDKDDDDENPDSGKVTGISLEKETLTLTMFATENLKFTITPSGAANKNVTWTSSDPTVVSVTPDGIVKALKYTEGGTSKVSSEAKGTAVITVTTEDGEFTETITVTTTMSAQVDMMTLPPMKDRFADYFLIGNITRGGEDYSGGAITNTRLTRHFNVLTAENVMKPSYYGGSRSGSTVSGLTYDTPDAFVNAATASGFKVHGHVLLWHSQNSGWITALGVTATNPGKEIALGAMRSYITQVMTRYKGKIYSWDVLNEAFPDGISASADWKTSIRTTGDSQAANPWFVAIGSDFVYEGFKAARLADPDAILYYNDYNLNQAGKSSVVAKMVKDVNYQWKTDPENTNTDRLLIEGIGMQSHHNTGVTVNEIRASLNRFNALGVRISISELDVLSMRYDSIVDQSPSTGKAAESTATNAGKLSAANLYGEFFKLFIEYKEIIERVTFWGVNDNASWRSRGLPLLFDGPADNSTSRAKPAYYKVIEALE